MSAKTPNGGSLAAGQSLAGQFSFTLPAGFPGVGQLAITVSTDSTNAPKEFNASGVLDTNRSATLTAQSTLAPYPDLEPTEVTAPTHAIVDQRVTVQWSDQNVGDATAGGPWTDTIYLMSADLSQNLGVLGNFTFNGTLAPGGACRYRQSSHCLPPRATMV